MFDDANALLWPVVGHLVLVLFLFVIVSWKRGQATKAGMELDSLAHSGNEPELSRRFARNLDNQFQVPMLFYALVALLFATEEVNATQIILAWVFLWGRIAHTAVQTMTDNVLLRGQVFMINFLAVMLMWLTFFASRWGWL